MAHFRVDGLRAEFLCYEILERERFLLRLLGQARGLRGFALLRGAHDFDAGMVFVVLDLQLVDGRAQLLRTGDGRFVRRLVLTQLDLKLLFIGRALIDGVVQQRHLRTPLLAAYGELLDLRGG